MLFPLLVERELRACSRNRRTWWIRLVLGGAAVALWLIPVLGKTANMTNGKTSLFLVTLFPFLFALFAGLFTTADVLSSERRNRTLDLLLLARVHPLELVLGKFVGNTLSSFYGLLVVVPILTLPLLLGSVAPVELVYVILLLIATFLFSTALSLFVSAFCSSALVAVSIACAAILLLPLVRSAAQTADSSSTITYFLSGLDPVHLFGTLAAPPQPNAHTSDLFLPSLSLTFLSAILILGAALGLPRSFALPSLVPRLSSHFATASALLVALTIISFGWSNGALRESRTLFLFVILAHAFLKLALAVQAACLLTNRNELEIILTTPAPVAEYLHRRGLKSLQAFAPAVAIVLAMDFLLLLSSEDPNFSFALASVTILLPADIIALGMAALWLGAKESSSARALWKSVAQVLVLPLLLAFVLFLLGFRSVTFAGAVLLWTILCLQLDALFAASGYVNLHRRLRHLIAN